MIGHAMAVAHKDLRLAFAHGQGPVQAILLGLLLVFMFSLSAQPGERFTPQQGVAIFWLCSAFGVVLIFSLLFRFEEENDTATALLLSPCQSRDCGWARPWPGSCCWPSAKFSSFPPPWSFWVWTPEGVWAPCWSWS